MRLFVLCSKHALLTVITTASFFFSIHFLSEKSVLEIKYDGLLTPNTLGGFLCIPTPNTCQLNPLFHTFAEFRLIVNRTVAQQSTDWLATNAQFSLNESFFFHCSFLTKDSLFVCEACTAVDKAIPSSPIRMFFSVLSATCS